MRILDDHPLRFLHGAAWILTVTAAAGNVLKLPNLCLEPEGDPRCELKQSGARVVCRKDYKTFTKGSENLQEHWTAKTVILCSWSEWYANPEEILRLFPFVQKLIIRNGNVSEFLTDFPSSEVLEAVILRSLRLEELSPTLFSLLTNLRHLDLRGNRLRRISPETISGNPALSKVLLADNPWDCSSDLKWTVNSSVSEKLINASGMLCSDGLYPGKPVRMVMYLIEAMENECPEDICKCSVLNIVWDTNKSYLVPVITVNCSGQGLLELPARLPRNTTSLILKRNNISDLLPLVKSNVYNNVADIYLDENNIRNIDVLEGALWLSRFRVFSIRRNHLRQLPIFALDNAFEKNANMAKIYLGNNPWRCDCMFTSDFQHLLIKYRSVIKDKHDIKCAEAEGEDTSNVPVLEISIGSVCQSYANEINPLDILSAVLALLILIIVGKLLYDYWMFKRTGKLPWLVAKMP